MLVARQEAAQPWGGRRHGVGLRARTRRDEKGRRRARGREGVRHLRVKEGLRRGNKSIIWRTDLLHRCFIFHARVSSPCEQQRPATADAGYRFCNGRWKPMICSDDSSFPSLLPSIFFCWHEKLILRGGHSMV